MSTPIRKTGDGDGQGSVLLNAAAEESEAPFAVREARITSSGLGSWAQRLMAQVPLDRSSLAGIGLGVMFLVGIVGLGSVNGDDPGIPPPTAGAAGSDDGGPRGQFTDGGLFSSEAPKKRSRAAGAAGKEAALAAQTDGQQPTGDSDRQSLDAGPAGPTNILGADLDPLGLPAADVGVAEDVNVGATTPGDGNSLDNAGPGGDVTVGGGSSFATTVTTRSTKRLGGPVSTSTTARFTTITSPPITRSASGWVAGGEQTTTSASPTTATSAPPTGAAPTPTQPSSTAPPDTDAPVDNEPLVAAPSNGSEFALNARVTFAANPVAGADQYCWTFSGAGVSAVTKCTSGPAYRLSLGDYAFDFGQVAVIVEAKRGATTLKTGSITINLILDQVLAQPRNGEHVIGRTMQIHFRNVSGATRYCYRLQHPDYKSGEVCTTGKGIKIGSKDPLWGLVGAGPLEVKAEVLIGGRTVGSETVTVTLIE